MYLLSTTAKNKTMRNKFLNTILFNLLTLFCFAQEFKDCETALALCGESPFQIEMTAGVGNSDQDISGSCIPLEFNSIWVYFEVIESGSLVFNISPSTDQDIDFILFESNDGDCNNKELIRCMASGETLGEDSTPCMGDTGLAFGETDYVETAGCSTGDNNFLRPLDCVVGNGYYLYLTDFSATGLSIELSFDGTALLDCISFNNTTAVDYIEDKEQMTVFPNPSNGIVNYELPVDVSLGELIIYDSAGRIIYSEKNAGGTGQLNLSSYENGLYYVTYGTKKSKSLIKPILITK